MSPFQLSSFFGNFGNTSGNTIWNHNGEGYSGYEVDSASEMSNTLIDSFLDPTGLVSGFWNDITGTTSQSREFAQQEYLQDKMNEYNTPANQMARMKAAGINPNTAAAGIAQSGSESAQAPAVASNTGGAAAGVGAAAGLISGLGSAAQGFAGAMETKQLLGANFNKLNSETISNLEAAGLSHWNAVSVATMLPYMEANSAADFYLKLANFDNIRAEYNNIVSEHDRILKDIDLKQGQIDLMEQQRLKVEEDKRWQKLQNDFFQSHGYRDDSPLDVSLRNCVVSGRSDEAQSIGNAIENASNRAALGSYSADASTAFERAYNQLAGTTSGEYDYSEVKAWVDANKEYLLNSVDLISKAPDSIRGGVLQFVFAMLNAISSQVETGHDSLKKPDKPANSN